MEGCMAVSRVDKLGRTRVPADVRRALGLSEGDEVEWLGMGTKAVVRKRVRPSQLAVKQRIARLRTRAPRCFESEPGAPTMLSESMDDWALAKLGLKE